MAETSPLVARKWAVVVRRTRAQGRKDANHKELVDYWRGLNGSWQDTCEVTGALDGIAGAHGIDVRVEIKDSSKPPSKRALTESESKTIREWKGRKPAIWETVEDVEMTFRRLYRDALHATRFCD